MTTTIETPTIPALTVEMKALAIGYPDCRPIRAHLYDSKLYKGWKPGVVGTIENAYFGETLGLKTKADYIEMRDTLKAWLRLMETYQRALKAQMKGKGDKSMAQMYKHNGAHIVTELIEIRRAGKIWSAAQAATKMEAVA